MTQHLFFGVPNNNANQLRSTGSSLLAEVIGRWGSSDVQDDRDLLMHVKGELLGLFADMLEAFHSVEDMRRSLNLPQPDTEYPELVHAARQILDGHESSIECIWRNLRAAELLAAAANAALAHEDTALFTRILKQIDDLKELVKQRLRQINLQAVQGLLEEFAAENIVA